MWVFRCMAALGGGLAGIAPTASQQDNWGHWRVDGVLHWCVCIILRCRSTHGSAQHRMLYTVVCSCSAIARTALHYALSCSARVCVLALVLRCQVRLLSGADHVWPHGPTG